MTLATSSGLPCLCCQRKALYRAKSVNRAPHERSPVGGRMWPAQGERRAALRQGRTAPASRQGGSSQLGRKSPNMRPTMMIAATLHAIFRDTRVSSVPFVMESRERPGGRNMLSRSVSSGALAAVVGAAMLAATPSRRTPSRSPGPPWKGPSHRWRRASLVGTPGPGLASPLGLASSGWGWHRPVYGFYWGPGAPLLGVALHLVGRAEFETRAP